MGQKHPTILVIEHEQDTLDLLSILLQRQGWRVRMAHTGSEGLAAAQDSTIDLVILDLMLPDASGFEVCLKIKENRPNLPVIFLSVRSRPIDIVTGLESGADDYITKPFATAEFLARVRAALRASSKRAGNTRRQSIEQDVDSEQLQQSSEFLSIVSHELRTPVAAIKGFVTTLLSNHRYWDENEREAFLENVNESVDQLSRLIENILEMGQMARGLRLHKRPTRLASLVERVFHDLSFQSTHCEFVNEVSVHLPAIAVDPVRIERVLRNLLENSAKFSPQGGVIRVSAKLRETEIEISVEDQGIGISPEHLPHIFERFYRVQETGAPQEGIGLGLYIAQELIHSHGGKIRAESQLGNGTTIHFTLPLNGSIPIPKHALPDSARKVLTSAYQPNGQPKILIVEDDPQMRQSLWKSLEFEGFSTLTTAHGSEAIELIKTEKPDLVLLDLLLPDIDGFDVCKRVRNFSNIPIIIITGQRKEYYKVRGFALGADDYLTKPFSNGEVLARIRALLRRTRVRSRLEPAIRLKIDGLEIDPVQTEINTPKGSIKLTPTEHKLLYYLALNSGRILTHQQILSAVWGHECDHQKEYLWVNISRLRKKIEPDPSEPSYIITEPGIGYCFIEPDAPH